MYRDDPLDDEMELRELIGDAAADRIPAGDSMDCALDVLRILQGWVSDDEAAAWFVAPQRRLDDRTPIDALEDEDLDDVIGAAQRWAAARG